MKKKVLSMVLTLAMVAGLVVVGGATAHAAVGDVFAVDGIKFMVLTENGSSGTVQVGGDMSSPLAVPYTTEGSLTIPDSVSYGGISYTVTSIGYNAFAGCSLTDITIPDNVASIGYNAFAGCSSLTSITIPGSVDYIDPIAFAQCVNLESFIVSPDNLSFYAADGVLYDKSKTELICYPSVSGAYTVPNGITRIGHYAFIYCGSLTSITIPSSVTYIGVGAFNGCRSLASVTIPESVTSILWHAFQACDSLTSVTIPSSVAYIGEAAFALCFNLESIIVSPDSISFSAADGVLFDKEKTMLICYPTAEGAYTIPGSVTSIYSNAFDSCRNLTSVTIPDGVTYIGTWAFGNCSGLTDVTIPGNVTTIGNYAFYNCSGLSQVWFDDDAPGVGEYVFLNVDPDAVAHVYKNAQGFPAEGQSWNGLTVEYRAGAITRTVTFVGWDGEVLDTQQVEQGEGAIAPVPPPRTGYAFTGWDMDFDSIFGDLTVTALYEMSNYTVKFVDWDNTTLKTEIVSYGSGATPPADPVRTDHAFVGWDMDFDNVTGDLTVTALYRTNVYTVYFYKQTQDGNNPISKTPFATQQVTYNQLIDWTKVSAGNNAVWYVTDGVKFGAKFDPTTPITGELKLAYKNQNNSQ